MSITAKTAAASPGRETTFFFDSTISHGSRTATNKFAYHLSADGLRLTATESFRGPRLKYDNVWVFDK